MTLAELQSAVGALRSARNALLARGWRCSTGPVEPAVSPRLGAQEETGPLSLITAPAHSPGPVFRLAYVALRLVTGAESLVAWEGESGRTVAEVLAVVEQATQRLHNRTSTFLDSGGL